MYHGGVESVNEIEPPKRPPQLVSRRIEGRQLSRFLDRYFSVAFDRPVNRA